MDLSTSPQFERVGRDATTAVAGRVAAALERQKADRERDLLGPSLGGSLALLVAGWFAGAFWPMLVVVALRIVPDLAAQITAQAMIATLVQGGDTAPIKARAEAIALLTGVCWGLAAWPVEAAAFTNLGAILVFIVVHVTAIMVMFMTVPSPLAFRRWLGGWLAAMAAPAAFAGTVAAAVVAITSLVLAGVLLWLSRRLHQQLRRAFTLQFENEDLAQELGAVNAALAHALAQSEHNARHDSLTGLNNRRAFEMSVVNLHRDSGVDGQHLLLIDLDHFKAINDQFGHASGDAALAAVSKVLSEDMLGRESCARWGGEEFVVLLIESDLAAAIARAESLRQRIAALVIESCPGARLPVTASIGLAPWHPDESLEIVVARADRAMYQAKTKGRNRVQIARPVTGAKVGRVARPEPA